TRWLSSVGPASDEQERFGTGDGIGLDDDHPMLPEGTVHFIGCQPGLRSHFQNEGGLVVARHTLYQAEAIVGVWSGNIVIQCSNGGFPNVSLAGIYRTARGFFLKPGTAR